MPTEPQWLTADEIARHRNHVHVDWCQAGRRDTSTVFQTNEISRLIDIAEEANALRDELKLWKPMTPEEADKAFDEAEAVPISDEEVAVIVARVTDPAYCPTEPERVQMAVKIKRQEEEIARLREENARLKSLLLRAFPIKVLEAIAHDDSDNWGAKGLAGEILDALGDLTGAATK